MTTKKFPVSISYGGFKTNLEEFIIPFTEIGKQGFRGLLSGSVAKYGMIAYIGKEIEVNDVFAKLVNSGQKIDNVDATLAIIDRYITELKDFKVGNVISISYDMYGDFRLIKEADRP